MKDDAIKVLHSMSQQIWKTQQWPQDWKRSVFILIPENTQTPAQLHSSHKVMLRILQARLQQYMNHELPDIQAGFRKGRGTRDQIANIYWIIKKQKSSEKNIYFCFMTVPKPLTVWITTNWKFLEEMAVPDDLTCLLRNLYARSRSNS